MTRWRFTTGLVLTLAAVVATVSARQLSSRPADEWIKRLDRPDRIKELRIDEIVASLNLKPGQVVADLGAGAGVFVPALSKAVSPGGRVYAVDIDQGFIDYMNGRFKAENITNATPVLGKFTDPSLPAKDVDVAFFHDVLHHIEDRAGYLKNVAPYVKPGGRIVIIELDPKTGGHKEEPELQVTKEQAAAWLAPHGFKPVQEHTFLADKWYVVYAR